MAAEISTYTRSVALRDELFPEGEANRHDGLLQTEWSEGWADAFLGLGALTRWMTPKLPELHTETDYAGAAVVFLQRHRVELGLKALLNCAGAGANAWGHDLAVLWDACEDALRPAHPDAWDEFALMHAEFVALVAEMDPDGQTFRYPFDKKRAPARRPQFIDLTVFESAGSAFEDHLGAWEHYLLESSATIEVGSE